jgi:DNA-binding transcriptional regulator PaaX
MEEKEWIILNYTLPKEPSRVRVSVWRKLKKRGSVNVGQAMWILPLSKAHIEFFTEISNEVLQNNGAAYLMQSTFIGESNTDNIIEAFNKARDEEYKEFLEKCEDFFHEIDKEIKRENFTFAEVEENEYEYNKLMDWYKNILVRDFFTASFNKLSEQNLNQCKQVLEDFSKKVYEMNSDLN